MSTSWKQFLFTLGAVLIVLLAYEHYHRAELVATREQAQALKEQAEALSRQTKAQTEALQEQANALREKTEAMHAEATAMKNEVAAEHQAAQIERERYQLRAYRMEGLAAAQSVKVAIAESYMTTGKLPRSNKEAGVAEPDKFNGHALERVDVGKDGSITLTYNEKSGERGGTIELIPDTGNATMGIKWRCMSADFSDIAQTSAQCEYRPHIAR
jgi:hypothetical protein